LPSPAKKPPRGPGWLHEIKHDGFRLLARRDPAGVRLFTRNGHDWSARFALIREAVGLLPTRSCLIDGEAIAFDDDGLASFELLRARHQRPGCRRAAEQRDERAPFHCPMSPVLPTERIAYLGHGGELLHCGISGPVDVRFGSKADTSTSPITAAYS